MPTVLSPSFQYTWLPFFLFYYYALDFHYQVDGLEVEKANTFALFPVFG